MRFFLPEIDRLWSEERARASFLPEPERSGHIRLYNKNAGETYHARIVEQCRDRYGWIVEMDEAPAYYAKVLLPEPV